jgi:hypothetical protein
MFTKKLEDQFSADLLNTVRGILGEAKHDKECECEKCEKEEEDDEDEDEENEKEDKKKEMKEGKTGLWANIHAKRKRIKAGSGERMRKPGSKGAPTDADFKAASESVEIEEAENKTGLPKSTAEKNKQHIEITSLLGHKRRVPVHPTNTYKALNRYRNDPSTKSARIVSEETELEEGKMKDLVTKHMDAGHDYETALKKAKKHLDVPFDGPYRKPGTRKDEYGNVVKNVAKHLARKAMAKEEIDPDLEDELKATRQTKKSVADAKKKYGMKEDSEHTNCGTPECCGQCDTAEQIDELSKKTLGSYVKKAKKELSSSDYHVGRAVGARETGGKSNFSPELERKLANRGKKRYHGIDKAVDKMMTKEEAEQIDELSKKTLKNYLNKRSVQTTQSKLVGANLRHAMSHDVGLRGTKPLISPETTKELEKVSKQALDFSTKKGKSIELARKKIGVASDYRKKLKVPANEEVEQIDELSKGTMGRYINKAADRMSTQGVTAGLKIAADEKSSKNFKNIAKRQKGVATAVSKLTKEEQDFIDSLNDVDQIDELSGATLGSYVVKSRKDETDRREAGIKTRDEIRKQTGLRVGTPIDRKLYSPTASRGAGQKMAVKKLTGQARVNAKEEVELEEGRGRPPKEGSAAWKARQNQANDDMTALGVQLRKAKSMNKKVRFMNGKEHEVHPNHVDRFEDHMAARKTSQDKGEFQKHAHKSHEDFVKAVTAPVPKVSKDTGEIVKYRH